MKGINCLIKTIVVFSVIAVFGAGSLFSKDQDTVVIALDHDVLTVNLAELKDGSNHVVFNSMHQGLVIRNRLTGKTEPSLAKSYEIIDGGRGIRFKLRKGLKFHNGDPVTAHDFKFSCDQFVDPVNVYAGALLFDEIEEVEVVDDFTIIYHFYEPYSAWAMLLSEGVLSKKYYEKVGRKTFGKKPVGTAPFRFLERKIGEYILLEAVENHVAYTVGFKRLKFMIVPDAMTRMAMLETGEVDLIYNIMPHQIRRLERNPTLRVKQATRIPKLWGIHFNQINYPVLKDPKLIEAVNLAINREEIVKRVFLGKGTQLFGAYAKGEIGYNPNFKYEFNPDKARRLLGESSYKPGEVFLLSYSAKIINGSLVAAIVQKYLMNVGLQIKLIQLETGVMSTYKLGRKKELGHFFLYDWGMIDPMIRLRLTIGSSGPYTYFPDRPNQKVVDGLLDAQAQEMNLEKRIVLLHKLEKEIAGSPSNLYSIFNIYAMNKRIDYDMGEQSLYPVDCWTIKMMK